MKNLMSKMLEFCQLYEKERTSTFLSECHNLPEYISIVKALNDVNLKDLGLSEEKLEEYFQGDTVIACEVLENSLLSIGFYVMPAET